ncbi:9502_t:CDS:1, partial [Funneliformis mosseae]
VQLAPRNLESLVEQTHLSTVSRNSSVGRNHCKTIKENVMLL